MNEVALIDEITGTRYPINDVRWRSEFGNPLSISDLGGINRMEIDQKSRSLWRYISSLPIIIEHPVSLGEGCTPLVNREFRGHKVSYKLEWFAPTGSFKDRGASVMLSVLKQQGIKDIVEDSSGNGGAAIAAYGAAAGIAVNILAPEETSASKIAQIKSYGAKVHLVPGPREAASEAALGMAKDIFYASHNWHPFFLQGTKSLGYEIWEDMDFCVPDNIVVPTGAGSNILGCFMAFSELLRAGEIKKIPRLFAVQPANCAPLDMAFRTDRRDFDSIPFLPTIAEGTAIKKPIRIKGLLIALRNSKGGTVAVLEEEISKASLDLARDGLYAEPTSAMAAAGFEKLLISGIIKEWENTVVILTGCGLKTTDFYQGVLNTVT